MTLAARPLESDAAVLEYVLDRPALLAAVIHEFRRSRGSGSFGGLTAKQAEALTFIRAYHSQHQITPTFQEIADGLGLRSKGGVHRLVAALKERGRIRRIPHRARSIVLVEP